MQCSICLTAERLRVASGVTDDPIEMTDRSSQLLCSTCGGPLVSGTLRDRVVAKLAQLARFGLAEGARPLFGTGRHN